MNSSIASPTLGSRGRPAVEGVLHHTLFQSDDAKVAENARIHHTHDLVHNFSTCKVGHALPKEPVQVFHILHIAGEGVLNDLFSFHLHLLQSPAPGTSTG